MVRRLKPFLNNFYFTMCSIVVEHSIQYVVGGVA